MALALTARRLRRVVARWRRRGPSGFDHEIAYWDEYFRTKGGVNADDYRARISEEGRKGVYPTQFQPFLTELGTRFPGEEVRVLDVGSGPISVLTWGHEQGLFRLACIDPLTEEYKRLMGKYSIPCPVDLLPGKGEDLNCDASFHAVHCQNALDHTQDPGLVVRNMVRALVPGGLLMVWSAKGEGSRTDWTGLHQHDLDLDGTDILLATKGRSARKITRDLPLRLMWSDQWGPTKSGRHCFAVVYEKTGEQSPAAARDERNGAETSER